MQSPPLELVLDVVHLGARNVIRNAGDADDDTISEITRGVVRRTRGGPLLLALGLAGFWWHIVGPIFRKAQP